MQTSGQSLKAHISFLLLSVTISAFSYRLLTTVPNKETSTQTDVKRNPLPIISGGVRYE
jgi:hypothetical protein